MSNRRKQKPNATLNTKRWVAYVAAGVSVASATQKASAELVSIEVGVHVDGFNADPSDDEYQGSLDSPAIVTFKHIDVLGGTIGYGTFNVLGANSASILGFVQNSFIYAKNVSMSAVVSTQTSFVPIGANVGDIAYGNLSGSQFLDPGPGLIGFRFDLGEGWQYGWARVLMDGSPGNTFTVDEYTYGDAASDVVLAGVSAVPEPGSLGLLALGAVGLTALRRKRQQVSESC